VGSSLANVYSVVSSGISALWGKRHGGANQEVITMLEHIRATGCDAAQFVERARTGKDRLMGFGHRIYKTFDPRAKILKEHCHKLLSKPSRSDPCFDIALQLEEIALKDDYFLSRNLYPNVDFYSGLILKAAGIPYDMFTVLFSIGRVPGWLAHWREMCHGGDFRLVRPRQVYVGKEQRNYVDTRERKGSQ
jgi:citrate synthase